MKIEFDYEGFEDYLFEAIRHARSLNTRYANEDDVLRYLRLAHAEVELFTRKVRDNKGG